MNETQAVELGQSASARSVYLIISALETVCISSRVL